MLSQECFSELQSSWLPNITDPGLDRIIDLLEKNSPLLIHGSFTRSVPMGCLATQVAWHHPLTKHLTQDAGIQWLHHVAHLNPATSLVLREWDSCDHHDFDMRHRLLETFKVERARRQQPASSNRPRANQPMDRELIRS